MGATPKMNRSAKGGVRSSPHYGGEGVLIHPPHQGVCGQHGTEDHGVTPGELRRRMHQSIPEQGKWLGQVVKGFFNYHAVPTNGDALGAFRSEITDRWRWTLGRRSEKSALTWARMKRLADDWLPKPRILHPWPNQ